MAFSNVSDDDATLFYLVRKGYGSLEELEQWDTPRLMDVIEYEQIQNDIEAYHYQKPRDK